jgi:site-specific recombinase XerD
MTVPGSWTLDALVETYQQHERRTRGLRDQTLLHYARFVRLLIRAAMGDDPIDLSRLGASDVVQFASAMTGRFSPRSMRTVGTALRSFFRFLRAAGVGDERLDAAIPTVAHWQHATLPRCLSEEQLVQVLARRDASSPCARRNYAIVRCLATLGLRPGEVAALQLEDLDWRRGTVHLRTRKTRRGAVLPLPRAAGRAIVDYLRRERPVTADRRVFVQHRARHRGAPISRATVTAAAARALGRAGVQAPRAGASVFRHTLASRLVRRGTPLKEVADVLGHRCLDTTTIYAKLDVPALAAVALPWPEVTP